MSMSDPLGDMLARLRASGAVDVARLQAMEMAGRARAALSQVPPSPARDELEGLLDLILNREE